MVSLLEQQHLDDILNGSVQYRITILFFFLKANRYSYVKSKLRRNKMLKNRKTVNWLVSVSVYMAFSKLKVNGLLYPL